MRADRPNILLLVGEDTGCDLGCYGQADAITPVLDGLAAAGMRCTRAYTHSPVCAPSRSGLVTGRYPYAFGAHHMRSTVLAPPPLATRALRAAGWHVRWPGKTDFNFAPAPEDFTDTADWLADGFPPEPFFAFANVFATHESRLWPEDADAAAERERRLAPWQRRDPAAVSVPPWLPDHPVVRGDLARHHENVTCLDQAVGEHLARLDAAGVAERTIVIFLVDHGSGIPRCKRWCYEGGERMPLIVRWPGVIAPGTVLPELVAWVDLMPTVLAWCGVPRPPGLHGQVIWGPDAPPPRRFVFGGRDRMDEQYDRIRYARSARFTYLRNDRPDLPWAQRHHYHERVPAMRVWRELHAAGVLDPVAAAWFARRKPAEELYDRAADPHELRNLAGDPAYAGVLAEHRAALAGHLAEVGDLGQVPERELIARGVVADRLDGEFRRFIAPLPPGVDDLGGPWDVDGGRWAPSPVPA